MFIAADGTGLVKATETVAAKAGTWPMRPTLPAALSRRLVERRSSQRRTCQCRSPS
jgi:hypothetical protein